MHDKKSDHYTSAKNYTDINGNLKSFDFVDHDIKTSIPAGLSSNPEETKKELAKYKESIITGILALPPSVCPSIFYDFTKRSQEDGISWDETMLRDPGLPMDKLIAIKTMIENKIELEGLTF